MKKRKKINGCHKRRQNKLTQGHIGYFFSLFFVLLKSCYTLGKKERKRSAKEAPRPHIIMIVADDLVRFL